MTNNVNNNYNKDNKNNNNNYNNIDLKKIIIIYSTAKIATQTKGISVFTICFNPFFYLVYFQLSDFISKLQLFHSIISSLEVLSD